MKPLMWALTLAAVLFIASADEVPPLTIIEGLVTGHGTWASGEHFIVVGDGRARVLAEDSHYSSIEYGVWVRLACTRNKCWVFAFKPRSD
jgi:hypothetical protein